MRTLTGKLLNQYFYLDQVDQTNSTIYTKLCTDLVDKQNSFEVIENKLY